MRRRLDVVMVDRGLAETRSAAAELVQSGHVLVSGVVALKTSRLVGPGEPVVVTARRRYVSRGGEKLERALEVFDIDVRSRHVLDVGSSTGGFTDCVLQHGAEMVCAIDVGRNQLHERMRQDPRVVSREGVNFRDVAAVDLPFSCSLVVVDVSFISLTTILPGLLACAEPEAGHPVPELVLLVKPQFEVGRAEASRGRGIITDPALHERVLSEVREAVLAAGGSVLEVVESPIRGAEGNVEFLMHVKGLPVS